jgi:hypothetical protein
MTSKRFKRFPIYKAEVGNNSIPHSAYCSFRITLNDPSIVQFFLHEHCSCMLYFIGGVCRVRLVFLGRAWHTECSSSCMKPIVLKVDRGFA